MFSTVKPKIPCGGRPDQGRVSTLETQSKHPHTSCYLSPSRHTTASRSMKGAGPVAQTAAFQAMIMTIAMIVISLVLPMKLHAQAGWHDEERLTNDPAGCITSPNNGKYITVDLNGTVHIVWADERDRNLEIYHKMKVNGVWTADERLTSAPDDSKRPILVVDGMNRVHLIWNDKRDGNKEIYHRIFDNGTWGEESRVTFTGGDSFGPSAVAEHFMIHLVHMEDINGHLQVIYREFNGIAWSDPVQLTDVPSGDRMVPSIDMAEDGTLHVVWWDTREYPSGNTNGKIYYREWDGSSWLPEELISNPDANAMRPSIAVDDSGNVHVAWINRMDVYDQISYREKTAYGWEDEIEITSGHCEHYHPSIDVTGNDVFLVYWDNCTEETNPEVFFRKKSSGSWSGPERISNGSGSSTLCCIYSEPNGNLHVGWVDTRDGNEEIYYREYIDPSNGVGDEGEKPDEPTFFSIESLSIFPNPFFTSTRLMITSPVDRRCVISIYDVSGGLVNEFTPIETTGGSSFVVWNGLDSHGRNLPPGVYFVRCRIGKKSVFGKVIYLR